MSLARAREMAVLSLLIAHPAHGYEIAKALTSGPLALLGLSRPSVYAILERFRARGWVSEAVESGGPYPDRTILTLTDTARGELDRRIARLGEQPLPSTVPALAALMSLDAGAPVSGAALARLIEARRAMLATWPDDAAHAGSATGRLARRLVETEIEVLSEVLAEQGA